MSYSNNPLLPKARADAVRLVTERHLPLAIASRKSGVHRTTLWRWCKRWQATKYKDVRCIATRSSRPRTSPHALPASTIERIRYWREHKGRCATVVHAHCRREGTQVSLSSVKRVLRRLGLVRDHRKWKRAYRVPVPRPKARAPGVLVQVDTIHFVHPLTKQRTYVYACIDIYSRWSYAEYHTAISQAASNQFLRRAQRKASFTFQTVQADNGPEFGLHFSDRLRARGIQLRHSRVRRPNDNAHIERFNRTIQDECLGRYIPQRDSPEVVQARLTAYLDYYNHHRLHLGLQCQTPAEMLQRL